MRHNNSSIGERIRREFAIWRVGAVPGLLVIGLVVFLRLLGLLQPLEWLTLGYLMRLRPAEPIDERILIVGINEDDIQAVGTYPIPDAEIAELIEALQAHQPRVIGLDIIRDQPVQPGYDQLNQVFQRYSNIVAIEQAIPDEMGKPIQPPPNLPPEQIGFADLVLDQDDVLRRALVGTPTDAGYKFSLPLLLTERYLNQEGLVLENGIRDPEAMRFGNTELTRVHPNAGGYVDADTRGNQFLVNYRSGDEPFHMVSLSDVIHGNVPAEWIRDRIVLIGMTAISVGDSKRTTIGTMYGVTAHAHISSQMLNSVLQNRPWFHVWADEWEYVWIIGWGIVGISLARFLMAPLKILLSLGLASLLLIGISYTALLGGWWLPMVPALLGLVLNSAGLTASLFYRYQQDLHARLHDRQQVIEHTYTAIHNNPVQTLKSILSSVRQGNTDPTQFCSDLERLEQELRSIEESVRQETLTQDKTTQLYLCGGKQLDLQRPINQLLYEVYQATVSRVRDFPRFETVIKVVSFDGLEGDRLTIQHKEGLCRFMEEALCNAGKYADGMTRLEVSCKTVDGWNCIRIVDNGKGMLDAARTEGYGTRQATQLARSLGGTFRRTPHLPQGTACELRYPVVPFRFWQFWRAC